MAKNFVIRLAGVNIEIKPLHSYIYEYCRDYLFEGEPEFTVEVSQSDLDAEREKSKKEDILEGIPVRNFPDHYLETLVVYRKIANELINRNILLYHGSCAAVDGVAYLFTAKSGTGKSTHVALWQKLLGERMTFINDDKPLLAVGEKGVVAFGTPWDGKHRRSSNASAPLKAICILERSETNRIEKITKKEGYVTLLQQTYRPKDPLAMAKVLQILDRLLSQVEIYRLGCNMNPEAAEVSFGAMNGE